MRVLDSIKPLLCYSRFLGIAPYAFKYNTLVPSLPLTLYSFLLMSVCAFFLFLFGLNSILAYSQFIAALISASHWLTMNFNTVLTIFIWARYKEILRLNLIKLNDFQVLSSRNDLAHLKSLKFACLTYFVAITCHCILFSGLYLRTIGKRKFFISIPVLPLISFFATYAALNLTYALCFQFVIFARIVRQYFMLVNDKFKDIRRKNFVRVKGLGAIQLGHLSIAHDSLNDISDDLASIFSVYFLTITVLVFIETIYTFTHYSYGDSLNYFFNAVWLSYYLVQFFAVLGAAATTSMQVCES